MWANGTTVIEVSFTEPVVDGVLDVSNWSYSPGGLETITSVDAVGGVVRITLDGAPLSVSSVSYAPPPFDVVGAISGSNVEAFAGYPVATS